MIELKKKDYQKIKGNNKIRKEEKEKLNKPK